MQRGDATQQQQYATIFYQGILSSQAQITKYTGDHVTVASTGEKIFSHGRNHLKPIDVLVNPYIGSEIKDVNISPFSSLQSSLSPFTWVTIGTSAVMNWYNGVEVIKADEKNNAGSIKYHSLVLSETSVGQETDIESHYDKYLRWKHQAGANDKLILYGVSRGAGTTFNAFAKYKYPEVKVVVLEGCFASIEDVLQRWYGRLSPYISSGISLFSKYRKTGPSPLGCVDEFPAGVPVVFVTSKVDKTVPSASTKLLAETLAQKQKNDVYVLELETAPHPGYMFDNAEDRNNYEAFIHAIYKKYDCPYRPEFAAAGEHLLEKCLLKVNNPVPLPQAGVNH